MPPNPPNKTHGFAMRSMSLRDMQIPKSEKKNSWPPPAKSWGRPCYTVGVDYNADALPSMTVFNILEKDVNHNYIALSYFADIGRCRWQPM